ncbi:hemerythrin domain-containing protein [uncultured Jatrophihabitans sp.]|uniref:hemerythrin domain-containing protein n=1 Tax=uncultured Jatrophihabitans sp. TaxID=1610747 RepID=UPI0035CC79A0
MTEDRERPRIVGRRSLLAAGAGLVVGAGGTELVNALSPSETSITPHVASPGEELMTEHGVLKRVLLAYRAIHDRLVDGRAVPVGAVSDSAQLISDYIESFHEGLEEAYVFPRVTATQGALVRTLLIQHDRGRHLTAAITTAASAGFATAAARSALASDLDRFVRMYEPHEAWEDTVIYPALRATTSQRTLDLLAERFAGLENTQFGDNALSQMLSRLAGIEDQLGIGDLAAFTPPATA